eukprot:303341_1
MTATQFFKIMFLVLLVMVYQISKSINTITCGDSLILVGSEFIEIPNDRFDSYQSFAHDLWKYYIPDIVFNYNGTQIGEVQFNPCNTITNISAKYKTYIFDSDIQEVSVQWKCDDFSPCCTLKSNWLQPNTTYHIVITTKEYNPDGVIKMDISCKCGYKCDAKQISCDNSISLFSYEFEFRRDDVVRDKSLYEIDNIVFNYNEEMDYIQFDPCNNQTTIYDYKIEIFHTNGNRIALMTDNHIDGCRSINVTLLPNTPYIIWVELTRYRPNTALKLDVFCHCDCNYNTLDRNILYNGIRLYDILDIELNITFYSGCESFELCNIFHLGSSKYYSFPKLSIDNITNNFMIQVSNNYKH